MILEGLTRSPSLHRKNRPTISLEFDQDLLKLSARDLHKLAVSVLEVSKPHGKTWDQLSPAEQHLVEQVFGPRSETGLPVQVTNFTKGDTADTHAYPLTLGNETTKIVVNGPLLMVHVTPHPESGLPSRDRVLVPHLILTPTGQLLLPSNLYTSVNTDDNTSLELTVMPNIGGQYQVGSNLTKSTLGKEIIKELDIREFDQADWKLGMQQSLQFMREWQRQMEYVMKRSRDHENLK